MTEVKILSVIVRGKTKEECAQFWQQLQSFSGVNIKEIELEPLSEHRKITAKIVSLDKKAFRLGIARISRNFEKLTLFMRKKKRKKKRNLTALIKRVGGG